MTIVSALKKLHKKMTGKDATGMTVANVVNSLSENYTGGGGGEPADLVTVTISIAEEEGQIEITADKRISEIVAAKRAGKRVTAIQDNGSYITELQLTAYGDGVVSFGANVADADAQKTLAISAVGVGGGELEPDTWLVFGID